MDGLGSAALGPPPLSGRRESPWRARVGVGEQLSAAGTIVKRETSGRLRFTAVSLAECLLMPSISKGPGATGNTHTLPGTQAGQEGVP